MVVGVLGGEERTRGMSKEGVGGTSIVDAEKSGATGRGSMAFGESKNNGSKRIAETKLTSGDG